MSEDIQKRDPVGAVLVIGGGIAGMQAALDLADGGYFVYLLDRAPSIGGVMAKLDKTFPTNDCSTCMLSPRLVEVASHEAIKVLSLSEVLALEGEPGRFRVKILKHPRYVDEDKCVGCGVCAEKCPKKVEDPFNENMGKRKAIFLDYPQAIPAVYTIDANECIYFQKGKCRACEKFCENNAIDFDQKPEEYTLDVGAVLVAPGFKTFDAEKREELGYGRYSNVITSIQFERMLAAAGPYGGHVVRPSDGNAPEKVAWIQCVGSRDPSIGKNYCSSVCCMYATKQAIIAKEHCEGLEPTIFFIDIRAHGKGFDPYYERARNDHGIRYVRSMISRVVRLPESGLLEVQYFDEQGQRQVETYGMVVLSVGLETPPEAIELAERLGLELDESGFAAKKDINPLLTARQGVHVCGVFSGPKDIPETVTQASGAAGQIGEFLAPARGSLIEEKPSPHENDVSSQEPRIGVFVCHCGVNIAGVVDVKDVSEYSSTLPDVVHAEDVMFACSTDSQEKIRDTIAQKKLNRVVVASCSPRTHEPLFQENLETAGLNKFLFEMVNIRDQCSWVHSTEPEVATEKAKDLIRMSVSRTHLLEPLRQFRVPIDQSALVIGGGIAGMTAALSLANQGYPVSLVEREQELGGIANRHTDTLEGFDIRAHLKELIASVKGHEKISLYMGSQVVRMDGGRGRFVVTLRQGEDEYELRHGAVIAAIGASEYRPVEYCYGKSERIMTQLEFQEQLGKEDPANGELIVMIQCVGSREPDHPYCSRLCCSQAISNAIKVKEKNPASQVVILYRDIRTYGTKEAYYEKARSLGVRFVRFERENAPEVEVEGGALNVTVLDQGLKETLSFSPDRLVLSVAVRPMEDAHKFASELKLPLDSDGFFMEAHLKLRPLDFASAGFFLCGLAHGPKPVDEAIVQAKGAAARAATLLSKKDLLVGGEIAEVDSSKCAVCLTCVRACPFGVPKIEGQAAMIDPAGCRGCGVCAASCPAKAIRIAHHTDEQIMEKASALFQVPNHVEPFEPRIIAFICTYCTYTAADMAGSMRLQYPANVRVVKLLCTGRVDAKHLLAAFEAGADAVMVSGCEPGDCHFLEGNYRARQRVAQVKRMLEELGVEPERLEMFHVGASDAPGWVDAVNEMNRRARELGPNPLVNGNGKPAEEDVA